MIVFAFTDGLVCPVIICDLCGARIQGDGIVGCVSPQQAGAVFLHKGRCDREWGRTHSEVIYWQGLEEFVMHLAFNAAPPAADPLASLPPPENRQRAAWRDLRPRLSAMVFRRDANRCRYCGSTERLSVDHIKPLSRGGSNALSNLVTACRSCNSRKHDKTPQEWQR